MFKQDYDHTSFVPLRCKPSCQSGPKALPSLSDAATGLSFSSLPEEKRWRLWDLVFILNCLQSSKQGFSIKRSTIWLPEGRQKSGMSPNPPMCRQINLQASIFNTFQLSAFHYFTPLQNNRGTVRCLHGGWPLTAPAFWRPTVDVVA